MSDIIQRLISAFTLLPGVGPKTAQRLVLYLLEKNRDGAMELANALTRALETVVSCQRCRNLSEHDVCSICADPKRSGELLCVVETPADVIAMEQTGAYADHYFVLMGHLSPIDGVGPRDLGLETLQSRVSEGQVKEIILALSSNVEGEATAHYINEMLKTEGIVISRLAQGLPVGGELDYVDGGTLRHALMGRHRV